MCDTKGDTFGHHQCLAQVADDPPIAGFDGWTVAEKAWCVHAPGRNDSWLCYRSADDCAARARLDPLTYGPCVLLEGRTALMVKYGDDDQGL